MHRKRAPFLMFVAPEGEQGGTGVEPTSPDFPANTPVKEMTVEQQVAYWRDKARKHEDRVKAFGELTPEQAAALKAENDRLKAETLSAEGKALEEAKAAGRAEVLSVLGQERAKHAFEKALAGRDVDPVALLDLDRSEFIDGDKTDMAKIDAWIQANTKEKQQQKANVTFGQGSRERVETSRRAAGEAEAEKRFGKKK